MGSHRVIVVDDDAAVLDSLLLLLESAGLEAEGYRNAAEFLERAAVAGATCVVVDVRLPGMNGLELVRKMRESAHRVPVILITGHLEALAEARAEADGILAILHKPFVADELLAWVERAAQEG